MDIKVTRDMTGKMRHIVHVRQHAFAVDESEALGGEDSGPTPHDLYDAALGACKALTVLWYAKRKQIPVEDIEVTVARDASDERNGTYRLRATLAITGQLTSDSGRNCSTCREVSGAQLMSQVTTEIATDYAAGA